MFSGNTSQVSADQLYVEDVFSTWLYTGTGAAQTITNGIDLAGKGGLVWIKRRDGINDHILQDTSRGANNYLVSNTAVAEANEPTINFSFASNGFSQNNAINALNQSGFTYASWTFREAPKFFDVVTYTGTGANRTIAHNLGVAPGCILVKRTDTTGEWQVYHHSNANTQYMVLNATAARATGATRWNSTTPTATEFTVGTDTSVNASGGTYVAYLFAHDETSEGIIQCGSYTCNSSGNATVYLGWEPQFLITKIAVGNGSITAGNWVLTDTMRGLDLTGAKFFNPNTSAAEASSSIYKIENTGFSVDNVSLYSGVQEIYIAIRRGPMKTPTLGTSVFAPVARSGGASRPTSITTGFPVDAILFDWRTGASASGVATSWFVDKLRNPSVPLITSSNVAQGYSYTSGAWPSNTFQSNSGYNLGTNSYVNSTSSTPYVDWVFRRAPSFFDQVCYTGTGAGMTLSHSLGVSPELVIIKKRSASGNWFVSSSFTPTSQYLGYFNFPSVNQIDTYANVGVLSSQPTNAQFVLTSGSGLTDSGATYVAYLYASCPGVSKVGSYTGNGSSQTINCGFAAGARFVMIKRTDSTGDWYVWDTARGIVAGNDPHLSLNTNADEVTTDDTIDTDSSGFVVNQVAATNVNVSSATYIYLAIA